MTPFFPISSPMRYFLTTPKILEFLSLLALFLSFPILILSLSLSLSLSHSPFSVSLSFSVSLFLSTNHSSLFLILSSSLSLSLPLLSLSLCLSPLLSPFLSFHLRLFNLFDDHSPSPLSPRDYYRCTNSLCFLCTELTVTC